MSNNIYEIINGISLSNRDYFTVMHHFSEWIFWNKKADEAITKDDIEIFKQEKRNIINKSDDIINASIIKYFKYLNKNIF